MNTFNPLLDYLHQSLCIDYFSPYNCYYYYDGEKKLEGRATFFMRPSNYSPCAPLQLQIMIAFTILDGLIDEANPDLVDYSFDKKYKALPVSTNIEKIKQSIYRIIRLIRNKITHSPTEIGYSDEELTIKEFKISRHALTALIELILVFVEYKTVTDKYFELIVSSYYRSIQRGISGSPDTHTPSLHNVSVENKNFYHKQRHLFCIKNVDLNLNNCVSIKRSHCDYEIIDSDGQKFRVKDRDDYLIKIKDDGLFLIPGFQIADRELIEYELLNQWRIEENWFGKLKILTQIEI
ncbi:MAG: hypothetical protein PHU06_01435 [Gallionella sp.]|nr:hypothetical protein [Gallionella sp.]MDD4957889.1 hypothetical protein [Gallionella sp.]